MADGCGCFKQFRGKIAAFAADQSGAVLPFVAAVLLVLIGFGTLAMDIPRFTDLQTQLQGAADAFALAGAAELDGSPAVGGQGDAISRATNAINTLMAGRNSSFTKKNAAAVTVQSITFYSNLPATDNLAMANGTVTADPTAARFVEVKVTPVTISTFFPATLLGAASNAMSTNAAAVAGFTEVVCQFTPMFICNPFEGQNPGIYDPANVGKEFRLKAGQGGTTNYTAGNYGFLDVNGQSGASVLRDALAATNPGSCWSNTGVNTEPGNVVSAGDAVNVRFDLYNASAKGYNNATNPPALNVRKGCLPDKNNNTCGEDPNQTSYCNKYTKTVPPVPPAAAGLTEDTSVNSTTGVGNGTWDLNTYWSVNHNGAAPPAILVGKSRYAVYQYEIANNLLTGATNTSPGLPSHNPPIPGEVGAPKCNTNAPPPNIDRRILYAAVVDCTSVGLKGGKATGVPVKAFAKFFFIQPVDSTNEIHAEFVGLVKPNGPTDTVAHDIVQLYR
jgi:hypothetical protein